MLCLGLSRGPRGLPVSGCLEGCRGTPHGLGQGKNDLTPPQEQTFVVLQVSCTGWRQQRIYSLRNTARPGCDQGCPVTLLCQDFVSLTPVRGNSSRYRVWQQLSRESGTGRGFGDIQKMPPSFCELRQKRFVQDYLGYLWERRGMKRDLWSSMSVPTHCTIHAFTSVSVIYSILLNFFFPNL